MVVKGLMIPSCMPMLTVKITLDSSFNVTNLAKSPVSDYIQLCDAIISHYGNLLLAGIVSIS